MLKLPVISLIDEPDLPKMTLRAYAHFSEQCLRSNGAISPQNCMEKRTDEATMMPFSLQSKRPSTVRKQ